MKKLAMATLVLLLGCGDDAGSVDAGASDSGALPGSDAGVPRTDAGPGEQDTCYRDERFTCVNVGDTYGERTFVVPAAQNWVNSGLFLRAGERARIVAEGTYRAAPAPGESRGGCQPGDLVARLNLAFEDTVLHCIDGELELTADKDGIVFVGVFTGNDLGETYETRRNASGMATVTITAEHTTVPTLRREFVADYDYAGIESGWVEIAGEHIILTLPTSLAEQDRATLVPTLDLLDGVYETEAELRGMTPYFGQRIRFYPDATLNPDWLYLAGNPVRGAPVVMDPTFESRLSHIMGADGEPTDLWGPAHELGHIFAGAGGAWTYQGIVELEAWPNLFSLIVYEDLDLALHSDTARCTAESTGDHGTMGEPWGQNPWPALCFLRQFQFEFGWDFYRSFFRRINEMNPDSLNAQAYENHWPFVFEQFSAIAENEAARRRIQGLFEAWGVPTGR